MTYWRAILWSLIACIGSRAGYAAPSGNWQTVAPLRYEFQHPQMGTLFRLVFFTEQDSIDAGQVANQIFARIDSLNMIFSDWLPESELNRLCQTAGSGKKIQVSPELFDVLARSKKFSRQTQGAFDVSVGPLTRLWRRSRTLKEFPEKTHLEAARAKVGWKGIEIYPKTRTVRLKTAGMGLDLGGIAQGWTADYCLKILRDQGIPMALVDAGGDLALGDAPQGSTGWDIELPAGILQNSLKNLHNCGITTSGATYRFVELDGIRYSHIIDPKTGMALTHRILVTVKAKNATIADAWATGLSVMGKKGWRLANKSADKIQVWLSEQPL